MANYKDYIFVLWGDGFDEVAATIFITEFRKAGLRVKVVALTPRRLSGAHGLALGTDMFLEQARRVAHKALCVVLPGSTSRLAQLANDPRLSEFFNLARDNKARFIVGQVDNGDMADLLGGADADVASYPPKEELLEFAREVAGSLAGVG